MKRFWFGVGLLIVLLALCLLLAQCFQSNHKALCDIMAQAGKAEPSRAADIFRQGREKWESFRHLSGALADHAPLEEIDSLFSQGALLIELGWHEEFALTCMRISELSRAIAESQALRWWSLL